MKEKTMKNYLILIGIIFFTMIVSLYLFSWLKQYKEIKLGEPIITEVIPEVKYNNFDSFLKERNFLVLYMCTTSENVCRKFEEKFKKFIINNELNNDIVYFNLGMSQEENDILDKIYNKYKHDDLIKKLNEYPSLLIFSEGKIVDLLSPNKEENLSIKVVNNFLEGYGLIND